MIAGCRSGSLGGSCSRLDTFNTISYHRLFPWFILSTLESSHSVFTSGINIMVCSWGLTCCCMNSSNEWNVQLEGAHHRRTSARATANKEWDSSLALSLCSVGNEALYTADQMIWRSNTLYSRRAITTRANTMTTMVHSIVHSNDLWTD
jgi:hypothetical protein